MSMHAAMLDDCRELVSLSCRFFEDYVDVKTRLAKERQSLRDKHHQRLGVAEEASRVSIRDPLRASYASRWIEYGWLLRAVLVGVTSGRAYA
ncbi:hypothetical protein AHAS_Ahas19G0249000 [Arachis hypogaea]